MCNNLKKMKIQYFAMILLAVLVLAKNCFVSSAAELSGTCGDKLVWTLNEVGTLVISGSGDMDDFEEPEMAPWYEYRAQILKVELPEELNNIGDLAFFECENLIAVTIPNSVKTIGEYAFAGCKDLSLMQLSSNVEIIAEGAFAECASLVSIRFPETLHTLGLKAFYRCESLAMVTVPASVQTMGTSVFSYCTGLVSANIQANIAIVPEWLFYACTNLTTVMLPDVISDISDFAFDKCEQLNTVYYNGEGMSVKEVSDSISKNADKFSASGAVNTGKPTDAVEAERVLENAEADTIQQTTKVEEKPNFSIITQIESNTTLDTYTAQIRVTVEGKDGWREAENTVKEELKAIYKNYANLIEGGIKDIEVIVYVKGTKEIDRNFIESLAGRDIKLTFIMADGSTWKMDGEEIDMRSMSGKYNLGYTLMVGEQKLCEAVGASTVFVLRFAEAAEINAEVLIRLPKEYARQDATLLQKSGTEFEAYSTVVVDASGYAHFYLASVTNKEDYYVALDVLGMEEEKSEAIIPKELYSEYGGLTDEKGTIYVVTGRKSSWGLDFNQVTWILIGVIVLSVTTVGVMMYVMNKYRLSKEYMDELESNKGK